MSKTNFLTISRQRLAIILCVFLIAGTTSTLFASRTNPGNQDEELGRVSWYRDYNEAMALSKKQNKPVLILFQEIPGCSTCRNYGHNVVGHPLMAEFIEASFIPLAIHNNKGGNDKIILTQFKEPAWNNPVVRIVDAQGKDLIKRISGNYSKIGLYTAMKTVLESTNKPVPEFAHLLGAELEGKSTDEKYFQMYCFWTGQKHLGNAEGVLAAEPGFMNGAEVVKVTYDTKKMTEASLNSYAKKADCNPARVNNSYRYSEKDAYFYLKKSNFKYLPLTEVQKTKINSALGSKKSATGFLSPMQLQWFQKLTNTQTPRKTLYNQNFEKAWDLLRST